jgi:hypothetical protein
MTTFVTTPIAASLTGYILMSRAIERQMRASHAVTRVFLSVLSGPTATPSPTAKPARKASVKDKPTPQKTVKAAPKTKSPAAPVAEVSKKPVFKSAARTKTSAPAPLSKPRLKSANSDVTTAPKPAAKTSAPAKAVKATKAQCAPAAAEEPKPAPRTRARQPSSPPAMPAPSKTKKKT